MRLSVRKGDRASLICEASGDRPMDISWRRNGIPISPDEDARSVIDSVEKWKAIFFYRKFVKSNQTKVNQFIPSNQKFVYFQRFDEFFVNFIFSTQIKSLFIFSGLTSFFIVFRISGKNAKTNDWKLCKSLRRKP